MGKIRVLLTTDELNQGYDHCKMIINKATGWIMSEIDFNAKMERNEGLSYDDVLTSNEKMTVSQYIYNKYFNEAKVDFGFSDKHAKLYAKECTEVETCPNEFVMSFKIRDVGYY
jgi:hypothetical protein